MSASIRLLSRNSPQLLPPNSFLISWPQTFSSLDLCPAVWFSPASLLLYRSLVVLHSQSRSTGSSINSPCQNGTGFLPQISNTTLTSRCPLLPCHQILVADDFLVPYCLPAFSCQSFQPVIKSHSVSLLPTSVPGSCPCYFTCLLFLLLSHSFLLHIILNDSRSPAAHKTLSSQLSIQCLTSSLP